MFLIICCVTFFLLCWYDNEQKKHSQEQYEVYEQYISEYNPRYGKRMRLFSEESHGQE